MPTEKKLFLLDAYALIFRAYYAFIKNPRINSKGFNTSAIFGFLNSLLDIINNEKPSHLAVVFDPPPPNFRHKMYSEYKANREATPEDIRASTPLIKELIRAFNIQIVEVEGFEADDVIGTLGKRAQKEGFVTYMMTSDKDYGQLVDENLFMYKPKRSGGDVEILGVEEINNRYSIDSPIQFIDILALQGDASDNIPGAKGIGEKTAIKLIGQYKNIENLYSNINDLKGKQKENLIESLEIVKLSKELVTIDINVPVEINLEDTKIFESNEEALKKILNELEFKTHISRLFHEEQFAPPPKAQNLQMSLFPEAEVEETIPLDERENIQTIKHNYRLVDNDKEIDILANKLLNEEKICFDTETTSLNTIDAELVGISFSYQDNEADYVPIPIEKEKANAIIGKFKTVLENEAIEKIGQNIKYDIKVLKNYGIRVKGKLFDTMIAHYLLQPELKHNLNFLAETYLNYLPVSIETLIGKKGKSQGNMRQVEVEKIKEYACEDADITWQLCTILRKELKENGLEELACNIEMPLINVLSDMEHYGVKIDENSLIEYAKTLNEEADDVEKHIFTLAGEQFNIASPKQLGDILFEKLKIDPNAKKTKTNQYSTGEEVLSKLVDKHEIIDKILLYRGLKKLLSTYVEAFPKLINLKTGKIHTSFNQTVTSTGRLSSNNPNLQNIPIREEQGREIRKAFIPSSNDNVIISADYSQIELRLMAHMSEDENMVRAFNNEEDIHSATAAKINNINIEQVTKDMRAQAKTANFGIIYGISAFGLSQRLNISRHDAKQLIDGYFKSYPKVNEYMNSSIQKARDTGYVETILGRRRYLKDINSRNAIVRGFAERNAINAPLQGSAADIIKIAMINIYKGLEEKGLRSKMIIQVHDELVFDAYRSEVDEVKTLIVNEMQNAIKLSIPLTVDIGVGDNWLEAH